MNLRTELAWWLAALWLLAFGGRRVPLPVPIALAMAATLALTFAVTPIIQPLNPGDPVITPHTPTVVTRLEQPLWCEWLHGHDRAGHRIKVLACGRTPAERAANGDRLAITLLALGDVMDGIGK